MPLTVEVIKRSLKGYELREATSLSDTVYDVDGGLAELRTWSKAVLYIFEPVGSLRVTRQR